LRTVARDLHGPWGLAYVDEEHFLLTNLLSNTVNLLSRDGDNQVLLDGLSAPMGLVHDEETVYVANYGSTRRSIEWYDYDAVLDGSADARRSRSCAGQRLAERDRLAAWQRRQALLCLRASNRGMIGRVDPQICGRTAVAVTINRDRALQRPRGAAGGLNAHAGHAAVRHTMFQTDLYWADITG